LIAQVVLLAALAGTVGLSVLGWLVGVACGLTTNAALAHGLTRYGAAALGPANAVTLTRATLVGGVTALIAGSFVHPVPVPTLAGLAVVAVVLDAVDGWVARRTDTASDLGARFDSEIDAFLILALSVYATRSVGPWVLAIGAARYAFAVAGWLWPWMRKQLPPRQWRKAVAAIQAIALIVVMADVLPGPVAEAGVVAALALLAESFGRDALWLWHRRGVHTLWSVQPQVVVVAGSLQTESG
jgi:phosphatidylglycerophosphate synthase